MRINRVHIISFGKFENFTIDFDNGFNMIYGENEYGKSTIMAFIAMMFYGCPSGNKKGRDISRNLRTRYMPWSGKRMEGILEFQHMGDMYRVEKIWGKSEKSDRVRIYKNGVEDVVLKPGEDVGWHFLNMDAKTFERSIYIGGESFFEDTGEGDSISDKISNISSTGDEAVSADSMIKKLNEVREGLVSRSGRAGELVKLRAEIEKISERYYLAVEQEKSRHWASSSDAYTAKLEELKQQNEDIRDRIEFLKLEELIELENEYRSKRKHLSSKSVSDENRSKDPHKIWALLAFVMIISAIPAIIYDHYIVGGFLVGFGVIQLIMSIGRKPLAATLDYEYQDALECRSRLKTLKNVYGYDGLTIDDLVDRQIEFSGGNISDNSIENLMVRYEANNKEISELYQNISYVRENRVILTESPETIRRELMALKEQERELNHRYQVACAACEVMEETVGEIRQSFGPQLNRLTSEIMSNITGGAYSDVMVQKNYHMKVIPGEDGHYREFSYLSSGTVQQLYLALRLAVIKMITESETLPLMLDDILTLYDDGRAQETLEYLKKYSENGQVIMFTCHAHIRDMYEEGIGFSGKNRR